MWEFFRVSRTCGAYSYVGLIQALNKCIKEFIEAPDRFLDTRVRRCANLAIAL